MLAALLCIALAPTKWFGPATADLSIETVGNPFSPIDNDVHAIFTNGRRRFDRLAYFAHGQWHATLAADQGGTYRARFMLNGKPVGGPNPTVTLLPSSDSEFVRLAGRRFELNSGKPYVPFGHDFGWQNGADRSYPEQLRDMGRAGLNWTRIWSCSWDGKNPFYPPDRGPKLQLGRMYEPALDRWDMIVDNCDKNDIKFQFVLFHHGLFSTTTDSNWAGHPWNTKNGGFLADPTDFFTNPTAKLLTKAWLRYAVARWAHSPAIMSWELFNEVQWVDAVKLHPEHLPDVIAWHKEMAAYVRSIDPYHHLVTSSSSESLDPRVFAFADYWQPHTYPPSVYGSILGAPGPKQKPLFFGEFGGPGGGNPATSERLAVRDGFWAGLLAGQAGPGQYWFWDRIYRLNLYQEYAGDSRILRRCGFAENPDARPAPIEVSGGVRSDLVLRPGRGWGQTDRFVYNLPGDAASGALPQLSGFIQGARGGNRKMMREPIRFRFTASVAGEAKIRVGQVSSKGGGLVVSVNGRSVVEKHWPNAARNTRVGEVLTVPFEPGKEEIAIDNPDSDWVTIDAITFPGIGHGVAAVSLRSDRYALARMQWSSAPVNAPKTLYMPGLLDGEYQLRQFDLETGKERDSDVEVKGGALRGYQQQALDEGVALFRQ